MTIQEKAIEQLKRISSHLSTIGETEDYTDVAIQALEQTQWIPVSEGLPEEGEPILLSTKTGEVFEGAYFDLSDNRQWYVYRDENYAWNNVVTAWQPLPKPYKAESKIEQSLAYADQDTLMSAT